MSGVHVRDWWGPANPLPKAVPMWSGSSGTAMATVYCAEFPFNASAVRSIRITPVMDNNVVLGILGATAANFRYSKTPSIEKLSCSVETRGFMLNSMPTQVLEGAQRDTIRCVAILEIVLTILILLRMRHLRKKRWRFL